MRAGITAFMAAMYLGSPMPAEAQIQPGPNGPYVVVDSNDQKVGGVLYYDGSAVTVAIIVDNVLGFVRISTSLGGDQLLDTWRGLVGIVYTSTDCTGTPYTQMLSGRNPGAPALAVEGGQTLLAADPAVSQMETIQSRQVDEVCVAVPIGFCTAADIPCDDDDNCPAQFCLAGNCSLDNAACVDNVDCAPNTCVPEVVTVYPLTEVGDLSAAYTPPFSVLPLAMTVPALSTMFHGALVLSIIGVFIAYDRLRSR